MKTKLHAEKQAQPAGIRVGIPALRMILPASLPARASPPGERTQISSIGALVVSAASNVSAAASSTLPSALSTRAPLDVSRVKRIVRLLDQLSSFGQVGFTGSGIVDAELFETASATAPAKVSARFTVTPWRNRLRLSPGTSSWAPPSPRR